MKVHARLLFLLMTLTASCGQNQEPSTLHQNASPNDPNIKVYKVNDGSLDFHVYVTKDKGYRIDCGDNKAAETRLLKSLGISLELLAGSRTISYESELYTNLNVKLQPRLTCQPEGKFLYKMNHEGQEKFFLADPSLSATRLYNIGCSAMIEAMGFDLNQAYIIPEYLLTQTHVFTASDDDDLSCAAGFNPSIWQRSAESDVNSNGLCDGIEDCVYLQTSQSLLWARRLDQGLRNWTAASAFCENLEYSGLSDWRLPTKDEALKAYQEQIWTELKGAILNNAPSTWTSSETPEGKAWLINLSNGNGSQFTKTYVTSNAVMCVTN
jgi:hypothetical protein